MQHMCNVNLRHVRGGLCPASPFVGTHEPNFACRDAIEHFEQYGLALTPFARSNARTSRNAGCFFARTQATRNQQFSDQISIQFERISAEFKAGLILTRKQEPL